MSMLRLSQKDLERLSKRAQGRAGNDTADGKPKRRGKTAKAADDAAGTRPRSGRMGRCDYAGKEVIVELDLAPRPKERARTFVDEGVLFRAFAAAHGDAKRFMALIKPKAKGGERDGGLMRTITPEDTKHYEEAVSLLVSRAMAAVGARPFDCPLDVVVDFRFEGSPDEWPTAQDDGDLDNLKKAVFDGMNKVAYVDDRLLVRNTSIKRCAERAGITVTMRPAAP